MPTSTVGSPAPPRVSAAKTLQRLLESSGAGEATSASFRFQRQDVSHLRSFITFAIAATPDYATSDVGYALEGVNTADAASMQAALYALFTCRGGDGLCALLLDYVASLSEPPEGSLIGGASAGGRKTTMSATTLEHKIRRLALFIKLQKQVGGPGGG
jgi:hypothetical protein